MSGKTKRTNYHIKQPFGDGGVLALEVLETITCGSCLREVVPGEYVTRRYSWPQGVQVYSCRECTPFRFSSNLSTIYAHASYEPVEFDRKW